MLALLSWEQWPWADVQQQPGSGSPEILRLPHGDLTGVLSPMGTIPDSSAALTTWHLLPFPALSKVCRKVRDSPSYTQHRLVTAVLEKCFGYEGNWAGVGGCPKTCDLPEGKQRGRCLLYLVVVLCFPFLAFPEDIPQWSREPWHPRPLSPFHGKRGGRREKPY